MNKEAKVKIKKKSIWKDRSSWSLLVLCLPALIAYILFNYIPLIPHFVIPFVDYKFAKGIFGSDFVGLNNFKFILCSRGLWRVLRNTMFYGAFFGVLGPVVNVTMALLLFEITNRKALKFFQTVITFPRFMSMVIVGYITYAILSPTNGVLNSVLTMFGAERIDVYMDSKYWPFILTIVNEWKAIGMGSMVYYASLMSIDSALFEAAALDGAGRWQKMRYISIPHLIPLASIYLILAADDLVKAGFDLYYVIPRDTKILYETTDVLGTYLYRALQSGDYTMGASVGLLQSIVGLILVVGANLIVKKISPENSLF